MRVGNITREAPAKINLSLSIHCKREDGFHDISSLMVPIELSDTVSVRKLDEGSGVKFECNEASLPTDEDNLAVAAAVSYLKAVDCESDAVDISLSKKIPSGAGLGGGSSDAAAVFLALNEIYDTKLTLEELAELSSQLGSDIPFFLYESACQVGGRGEKIEKVPFDQKLNILLAKPDFGISTPWAYQNWKSSEEVAGFCYQAQEMKWGKMVNDLERSVFGKYLFLGVLKNWFLEQPEVYGAMMSGSGATVFALVDDAGVMPALMEKCRENFSETIWLCATKSR